MKSLVLFLALFAAVAHAAESWPQFRGPNGAGLAAEDARPPVAFGPEKNIAMTFVNFGERYLNARTALARDFVAGLIKEIYPKRTVEVTGSHSVDVSLMRQGEKLTVHLVNTAGPHENQANYVFDEIPAVGPLAVRIRTAKKPTIVTLEPGKRPLAVRYDEGVLSVTVPRLAIHEVVVVEP